MHFIPPGEPLPAPDARNVPPLRAVHSSFIVVSRARLREAGHFERYEGGLEPAQRLALDALPTGVWVPLSLARAHLEACEQLGLSEVAAVEAGRRIASRLHGPVLRTALRLAGIAGATPLLLAARTVRFWPERNQGAELRIAHTGVQEARFALYGYTLADIGYARLVWRGILEGNARLVMPRVRVFEITRERDRQTLVYGMTW